MRLVDKRGYVKVKHDGKMVWEHRLVWFEAYGYWPVIIDHVDGDKTNNNLQNLRDVSKGFNNHARPVKANSTTKIKGVFPNGSGYMARVAKEGKKYYLGTYKTVEEAATAYNKKAEELYGKT